MALPTRMEHDGFSVEKLLRTLLASTDGADELLRQVAYRAEEVRAFLSSPAYEELRQDYPDADPNKLERIFVTAYASAEELVRDALRRAGDRDALHEVRFRAQELREYLSSEAGERLVGREATADESWLAEIYELVANESPASSEAGGHGLHESAAYSFDKSPGGGLGDVPPSLDDRYDSFADNPHPRAREPEAHSLPFGDNEAEERSVGSAFLERLLPGLPEGLVDIEAFFRGVGPAEKRVREALAHSPAIQAGGPKARALAAFAITPIALVDATACIAAAARAHYRVHELPPTVPVCIDVHAVHDGHQRTHIAREVMVEELMWATHLALMTASRFFDWIAQVAKYKPLLLDGFRSVPSDGSLMLTPTEQEVDLETAWGTSLEGPTGMAR
jgi:hypothetical protein